MQALSWRKLIDLHRKLFSLLQQRIKQNNYTWIMSESMVNYSKLTNKDLKLPNQKNENYCFFNFFLRINYIFGQFCLY